MSFIPPVRYTDKIPCSPHDDVHRKNQYNICQGINITSLGCALNDMVEQGVLDRRLADIYKLQAQTLLAVILSENNRVYGF